jgi:hypothetical protein
MQQLNGTVATTTCRRPIICKASSSGPRGTQDKTTRAINEFIRKSSPKVEEAFETLKRKAKGVWQQVDDEHDVTRKLERATTKAKETALDIDQQWGVRRRWKVISEDLTRNWPRWSRQFDEFSQTPVGKVVVVVGLFALLASPFFWALLNWALLAWWILLPIASILTVQKAQQEAAKAQAAAAEEQERRRNPFASMFNRKASGKKDAPTTSSGGPVIEADFKEL